MNISDFSPKVSIIIPVYNGSNYLREAIDSALAQTYKNIEVIVVNDGSKDEGATEGLAISYGERIRYFYKENGGVASALNMGIREMTGEYFSWLSHDDVYYPQKIAVQVEWLKKFPNKLVILYSNHDLIDDKSRFIRSIIHKNFRSDLFCIALTISNPLHGCDALVPQKCFAQVGVFNEKLKTTNDFDMWFRLAQKYEFVHIPECLIQGREHGERGSVQMRPVQLDEINKLNIWMLENIPSQQLDKYLIEPVAFFYLKCVFLFVNKETYKSAVYALAKSFKCAYGVGLFSLCKYGLLLINTALRSFGCIVLRKIIRIKKKYIKHVLFK